MHINTTSSIRLSFWNEVQINNKSSMHKLFNNRKPFHGFDNLTPRTIVYALNNQLWRDYNKPVQTVMAIVNRLPFAVYCLPFASTHACVPELEF